MAGNNVQILRTSSIDWLEHCWICEVGGELRLALGEDHAVRSRNPRLAQSLCRPLLVRGERDELARSVQRTAPSIEDLLHGSFENAVKLRRDRQRPVGLGGEPVELFSPLAQ